MREILILPIIFMILLSCDNREDIFKQNNTKPYVGLKSASGVEEYSQTLVDTFKTGTDGYEAKIKIEDNHSFENLDIQFLFEEDKEGEIQIEDSILLYTPNNPGLHSVQIRVIDPYGTTGDAYLILKVYDNYPPIPALTFSKLNNGNYRVNASASYDPDGEIVKYEYEYGVNTISTTEDKVEIWAEHLENNGGVTLILTDDKGDKSEPRYFELELEQ